MTRVLPLLALLAWPAAADEAPLQAESSAAAAAPGEGSPEIIQENLIRVKVHRESRDWSPVGVRKGGDASALRTRFTRRIVKVKGKPKGEASRATAVARVHAVKDDKLLIVSVFPASLRPLRKHLEARWLVIEGWLEKLQVAVVTAGRGGAADDDSVFLRRRGVPYLEEFPGEGRAKAAALSLSSGEETVNAAEFFELEFADGELGVVSFSYKTTGLGAKRKQRQSQERAQSKETAATTAKAPPEAPAASKYKGPFDSTLELPEGYEAETVAPMRQGGEALSFHPKGSQEGAVRLEALPIDNPAVGGRADLPVYKAQISEQLKASESQFTTTDVSIPLPGFEMKVAMPHPQMVIVLQGKKTIYVFSASGDGPALRGLVNGLKDP